MVVQRIREKKNNQKEKVKKNEIKDWKYQCFEEGNFRDNEIKSREKFYLYYIGYIKISVGAEFEGGERVSRRRKLTKVQMTKGFSHL